jgi:hypothetical protein
MGEILFTSEECEWLKSFYITERAIDGAKPTTLLTDSGDEIILTIRQGRKGNRGFYYQSQDPVLINFLLDRLHFLGIRNISQVKYIKYEKGDVLAPHVDFGRYGVEANYKTLVVQLSDENDYVGGDFCLRGVPQSRKQGSYNFFLRTVEHEVTEVTDGVRFSMTLFLTEDDIDIPKTLI